MKKVNLLFFVSIVLFTACNNHEMFENEISGSQSESEVLEFTYKGEFYSSHYEITSDSMLVVKDPGVSKLYEKLSANPELVTFESSDGNIEFFDNFDAMRLAKNLSSPDAVEARAQGPEPEIDFRFYEGKSYTGLYLSGKDRLFINGYLHNCYGYYADLEGTRWDDVISSIKLRIKFDNTQYNRCFVIIYRNARFSNQTRIFDLSLSETSYDRSSLSDIHFRSNLRWIDWNDRITCIGYRFDTI